MERGPRHLWLLLAWAASAAGALLDWGTLLFLHAHLGVSTGLATAAGLAAGNLVNFAVNRRFAFPGAAGSVSAQALRYLLVLALVIPVHASVMALAVDGHLLPLAVVKVACDFLVFALLFPVLLRTFVFPRVWRPLVPARLPI